MASDGSAGTGGHFARRRFSLRSKMVLGGTVVVAVIGVVIGITVTRSSPAGRSGAPVVTAPARTLPAPSTTSDAAEKAALAAAVVIKPGAGTTAVALNAPVTVRAGQGHLTSVNVAPVGGTTLAGAFNAARTQWTSRVATLAAASQYKVTAAVTGEGTVATRSTTFATLRPLAWVGVGLWPESGLSVGVGQPVVLKFDQPIPTAGRPGVLAHLHLSLSTPVPVGAYWFSSTELHLRPQTYWPSGEKVSFSDDLDGWNAGHGMWGHGSGSVTFSIGDARISTANLATDTMTVTDNGQVVGVYPISGGREQYPTMNGTHIVLDRSSVVTMNSATVGIPVNSPNGYDETVLWDVHISDSGEYVHAAPWSVGEQGHENVSHGCVNLSTANAQSFFNFSRVGDIVVVEGGPRPPVTGDHGVMDWTTPWSSWTPVSVRALT
jgi:lipoprotein-anchoring transpeptidase ErfK/SrfK